MTHQIIAIVLKELKVLWVDREALALLFAMPVFFILVMSFALEGVFEAGSKGHPIHILVVRESKDSFVEQVISDLKRMEGLILLETYDGIDLTLDKAEQLIGKEVYPVALLFTERGTGKGLKNSKDLQNQKATVYLISDPAMNIQLLATVKGVIQGVIERQLLLTRLDHRLKEMARAFGLMEGQFDHLLKETNLEKLGGGQVDFVHRFPQGCREGRRPTSTEQNVPAYTIFGVFFIVLTLSSGIFQEKRDGTFQRILAAPLSKASLLIGKLLPYFLVNLVQIGLMFCIGVIVFGIEFGDLSALIVISLALAAAANGLGLLVAALGKTEAQVNGLSVLLAVTLAALGGMMVPTFIMPDLMKTLALFTPHAWALKGYHDVIIRGLGVKEVLTEAIVLFGFASFFFVIALWRFRFDR